MKNQQQIIEYCLTLPGAYLDYPFDERTPVLRHAGNRKVFALFTRQSGELLLNLKCEPMQADFWRGVHKDVIPGYHMNKLHWNSVRMQGQLPDDELWAMIHHSHALTAPKRPRRKPPAQENQQA